jgi:hypothetical protein
VNSLHNCTCSTRAFFWKKKLKKRFFFPKQSRKKGSFHSISEAGASPMRFRDWPSSWWTRLKIQRFSKSHLLVLVPPFHFHDNFSMALNVLRRCFALSHLLRNASQAQVVPGADGPEKVTKTTKQASSGVPFLLPTLARDRTFQNMIGIHFCYWCVVVLWPGRRHFYVFTVSFRVFFSRGFAFFEGKKK